MTEANQSRLGGNSHIHTVPGYLGKAAKLTHDTVV